MEGDEGGALLFLDPANPAGAIIIGVMFIKFLKVTSPDVLMPVGDQAIVGIIFVTDVLDGDGVVLGEVTVLLEEAVSIGII